MAAADTSLLHSSARGDELDLPAAQPDLELIAGLLMSEFRYGTCSRGFRFPVAFESKQLQAVHRDGLLTATAPKADTVSTVSVKVEG